jgi:transcriptional regulator with XRE-family HTH domain
MRQIGLKLKELRDAKGWTQDDLAEATGMNRVTIAKYESGRSEPKSASLGKLAMALGVDANTILGIDDGLTASTPINDLSEDEIVLLERYRALSDEDKELLRSDALRMKREAEKGAGYAARQTAG